MLKRFSYICALVVDNDVWTTTDDIQLIYIKNYD